MPIFYCIALSHPARAGPAMAVEKLLRKLQSADRPDKAGRALKELDEPHTAAGLFKALLANRGALQLQSLWRIPTAAAS